MRASGIDDVHATDVTRATVEVATADVAAVVARRMAMAGVADADTHAHAAVVRTAEMVCASEGSGAVSA